MITALKTVIGEPHGAIQKNEQRERRQEYATERSKASLNKTEILDSKRTWFGNRWRASFLHYQYHHWIPIFPFPPPPSVLYHCLFLIIVPLPTVSVCFQQTDRQKTYCLSVSPSTSAASPISSQETVQLTMSVHIFPSIMCPFFQYPSHPLPQSQSHLFPSTPASPP